MCHSCFLLLLCFNILFSHAVSAKVPDDTRHPSRRAEKPSAREIEQEREWIAVDKTSAAALQAYLDKKPKGRRCKEAAELLPVAKKLEAILSGTVKPTVVIPFGTYGERKIAWEKKRAKAVSYDAKRRFGNEVGACWTYESVDFEGGGGFSKGVHAHLAYAAFPGSCGAGPGSILAFDSGGDRCPNDRLPVIVSTRGKVVYFGIIGDVGHVHLAGEGQVAYPDGKTVQLR